MSITVFAADDGVHGLELWRTDGTTGRTTLLKDIRPGASGSSPSNAGGTFSSPVSLGFAVLNGYAYFSANDGSNGTELWRTDGTAAGTVEVTDMPGVSFGTPNEYRPTNITAVNGHLFFQGLAPGGSTFNIYETDGTPGGSPTVVAAAGSFAQYKASGTHFYWAQSGDATTGGLFTSDGVNPVEHLTTSTDYSTLVDANGVLYAVRSNGIDRVAGDVVTPVTGFSSTPSNVTNVASTVYFTLSNGSQNNNTLYRIAPDAAAATLVASGLNVLGSSFAPLGDELLFFNTDASHGMELWISDGTAAGTTLLADTRPGPAVLGRTLMHLTPVANFAFFEANDGRGGSDLWRTDGTSAGTFFLKHIVDGGPDDGIFISPPPSLKNMTVQDGILYFGAQDGQFGTELWRSDGTPEGTVQISINSTTSNSDNDRDNRPGTAFVNGVALFSDDNVSSGYELWVSDGTQPGTHMLLDIASGAAGGTPRFLTAVAGQAFFEANDRIHGYELWASDGTSAGTHIVRDIAPGPTGSTPIGFTPFGDHVLFYAFSNGNTNVMTPWASDGTSSDTFQLANVEVPVPIGNAIPRFMIAGTHAFFNVQLGGHLWVTDGTVAGTHVLSQASSGGGGVSIGNALYYVGSGSGGASEIWKTDGTDTGSSQLTHIYSPGNGPSQTETGLSVLGNNILFFANPTGNYQLYASDGTAAGTHVVDATSWTGAGTIAVIDGKLFIDGGTAAAGGELWVSDGVSAPTLFDIQPGSQSSNLTDFTVLHDALYFTATPAFGRNAEVWTSDGTAQGTHAITPLGVKQAEDLTVAGDKLFFSAFDSVNGITLWVSDGTSAGTHIVVDLNPNSIFGNYQNMHAIGSSVEFLANDEIHGTEVWISDGTAAGTFMPSDSQVPNPSNPSGFATLPGTLDTGPETLSGTAGSDVLAGGAGNDVLNGLAGDDLLSGGAGDDNIHGDTGNDTAIYTGNHFNQPNPEETFTYDASTTTAVVTDNRGGAPDGMDTLTDVETIKFADGYVVFDTADVHTWLMNPVALDTQGSIVRSTFAGDNGSTWSNFVDTGNNASVLWTSTHFDANGNAIQATTTNDDGSHALTLYDPDNIYSFSTVTIGYDATWNQTGVVETNDDASSTVRPAEIGAALDTVLWFTTPYDPDTGTAATAQGLTGGGNTDVLYGFGGNDTLDGGGGNDIINGGKGDDILTGGTGTDTFSFAYGDGNDMVTDFTPGDVIALHGYDIANFAQLQGMMSQIGSDTVIVFDVDNAIVLQNVTAAALNSGDFVFG